MIRGAVTNTCRAWSGTFASACVLLACGSSSDLVIGKDVPSAGTGGTNAAGSAGAPLVAGMGGSADAGTGGTGGSLPQAGGPCVVGALTPDHRYSFDGTGGAVLDSIGAANGTLVSSGTFDGQGVLQLEGGYVDLPNHLLKGLSDVTFMAWTSWPMGGSGFTRIFDFGSTTQGEDPVPVKHPGMPDEKSWGGTSYVMASPFTGWGLGRNLGAEVGTPGIGVLQLPTTSSIKDPVMHQVTVVFRSGLSVDLYLDALLLRSGSIPMGKLSDIDDVNNWLGRSQTGNDANYSGAYTEFRIYARGLADCEVAAARNAGPDAL